MMDEHDITGAKTIVNGLYNRGLQWHRGPKSDVWNGTYEAVRDAFFVHDRVESVDAIFLRGDRGGRTGDDDGPQILLAPPERSPHIVCFLGTAWVLTEKQIELTLYLNMFGTSQLDEEEIWHRGYRMELAHKGGTHDYTHVQPINAPGRVMKIHETLAESGVPETFPAFALRGRNLTTLCAGLAVALEGKVMLAKVVQWLKGHRYREAVAQLLN